MEQLRTTLNKTSYKYYPTRPFYEFAFSANTTSCRVSITVQSCKYLQIRGGIRYQRARDELTASKRILHEFICRV